MEINANLLSLTAKKISDITVEAQIVAAQTCCSGGHTTTDTTKNDCSCGCNNAGNTCGCTSNCCSDTVIINGEEVNLFGTTTDAQIINFVSQSKESGETTEEPSIAPTEPPIGNTEVPDAANPKESEVIQALYDYYHPKILFTNNYGFNDADSLFVYLDGIYQGVKDSEQITKAQLTELTQSDAKEDANSDFFGVLNRAFSEKSANETITKEEINALLMKSAGSDYSCTAEEFQSKVLQYAQKVQNEFASKTTNLEKIDFILDKTRDYLTIMGLQDQLDAMDRLLSLPDDDINNDHICSRGKIAFVNMTDGLLGGYQFTSGWSTEYTSNGQTYSVFLWAGDEDTEYEGDKYDGGLTLNSDYLNANKKNWYDAVATMVHELTHATAYLYTDVDNDGNISISERGLKNLFKCGALSQNDYDLYYSTLFGTNNMSKDELNEMWNRLAFLTQTLWGEYAAYQVDADYADSIGGDIFDVNNGDIIAASGAREKSTIEDKVKTYDGYPETQPYPTHTWWTYNATA